jgi:RNA polymerase sigma factor (sigma-70 family)
LVQTYARLVHSIPVRHGLTPAEIEDVGQEVFLALAQNLHRIEDPDRLPAWLITTARRASWRVLQHRKREAPLDVALLDDDLNQERNSLDRIAANNAQALLFHSNNSLPSLDELFNGWQRQEALQQGMQRLSERCRSLLAAIFLEASEPSYDEISDRLQIPKGGIGPTRNRCLQQLRAILDGLGFTVEG